jgi:hypothetical protein
MLVLAGLPTLFPKLVATRTFSERMFEVMTLRRLSPEDSRKAQTLARAAKILQTSTETVPVTLPAGTNVVRAVGSKGDVKVDDSLVWSAPIPLSTAK